MFHQKKFSENHSKIEGELGNKELRIESRSHNTDDFSRGLIPKSIGDL